MLNALSSALQAHKQNNLVRQRNIEQPRIDFASSDYLGFSKHPELKQVAKEIIDELGIGSGASAMVTGHTHYHQQLEHAVAAFTKREKAIVFTTGYMANVGILSALVQRQDLMIQDKSCHASLIDGAHLSRGQLLRFRHNDISHLRTLLAKYSDKKKLVVTESVFSVHGEKAPLEEIANLCMEFPTCLLVDEAHGFGVLGHGAGAVSALELSSKQVPLVMGTFSKALGSLGGFVAGDEEAIEGILQFARSYTYSTALPPLLAGVNCKALQLLQTTPAVEKLQKGINFFEQTVKNYSLSVRPTGTAIQAITVGNVEKGLFIQKQLQAQGIAIGLMRPPSVSSPQDTCLRIALNACHSEQEIREMLEAIEILL